MVPQPGEDRAAANVGSLRLSPAQQRIPMATKNAGRKPETVRFRTTLRQAEGKKATGLIVPVEVIE